MNSTKRNRQANNKSKSKDEDKKMHLFEEEKVQHDSALDTAVISN
jgi:hypothetical protein